MSTASISDLQHFFEGYAACIARGDAHGIAQYFATPCMMISDEKTAVFTDASAVESLFQQGFAFLRRQGIISALPDARSRRFITPVIMQAALQWSYYDGSGRLLYACDYLYTLHHQNNKGWKIETALSINEKERMAKFIEERI